MSDKDQPAFPRSGYWTQGMPDAFEPQLGMTLRDYFASQCIRATMDMNEYNINEYQAWAYAQFAYMVADAMLKERAK